MIQKFGQGQVIDSNVAVVTCTVCGNQYLAVNNKCPFCYKTEADE